MMPAEVSSVGPNPPRSPCFRRAPLPSLWCEPQIDYFYVLAPFGGNQFSILLILLFGWLAGWLDPGFVHCSYVLNWLAGWLAGKSEIYNRNAARKTTENIIRIAQNSSVKVVQMVNILILARLFNVKLTCAKMFLKARPANSQIDRIVGFQFWWETSADFKYVGIVKCQKLSFWLIFIYICGVSAIVKKHILDHLEVASERAKFTTEMPRARPRKHNTNRTKNP